MAALGLVISVLGNGGTSEADLMVPTKLPLGGFGEILIDAENDRLFISGGENDNRILVLDLDGNITSTISSLPGAFGMAFSPDGSILWVAVEKLDAVVGLSTTTLAEVDRVSLPGKCPRRVAVTGTAMAVGSGCYPMVTLDLAGDRTPNIIPMDLLISPLLATDGLAPGLVFAIETAHTGNDVFLLDISTGTATFVESRPNYGGGVRDLSLSPDGSTAVVAAGSGYGLRALNVADLSDVAAPTMGGPAVAVAWSPDGTKLVGGNGEDPNIHFFADDSLMSEWTYDHADGPRTRGLAISPDNTKVYVLTYGETFDDVGLHVLTVGVNPGTISGNIAGYDGYTLTQAHVDLFDEDGNYLFTVDADDYGAGAGDYAIENLAPGTYYAGFWNGDEEFIYDFFSEWYDATPLLRGSQATPIVVGSGQDVAGIDAELRWLYADMFGHTFEADIYWLGNTGITKGCNPPENYLYCPDDTVTRGQMAAFLVRALGLTDTGTTDFVDDNGSVFEPSIEKLAAAGITKGCNPPTNDHFCPDDPVTRGQMAAFMKRALSG